MQHDIDQLSPLTAPKSMNKVSFICFWISYIWWCLCRLLDGELELNIVNCWVFFLLNFVFQFGFEQTIVFSKLSACYICACTPLRCLYRPMNLNGPIISLWLVTMTNNLPSVTASKDIIQYKSIALAVVKPKLSHQNQWMYCDWLGTWHWFAAFAVSSQLKSNECNVKY